MKIETTMPKDTQRQPVDANMPDPSPPPDAPEIVIQPSSGWQLVDWQELWRYRDLLYFLTWRDIKAQYAQSTLGIGWAFIKPIFSVVVFTIIFGKLVQVQSDGAPYAIFSYAAIAPWSYFSASLTGASNSLITGAAMITKVYFPRLILPLSAVFNKLFDLGIAMIPLAIMMLWYRQAPTIWVLTLPLLVLIAMCTATGLGMLLTSLAVQFRDIKFVLPSAIQLLMYGSPVVYPASLIPHKYRLLYGLNPMAGVIEGFRSALLATNPMPWDLLAVGACVSMVLLVSGAFYFRRMERIFADVA